MFTSPTSGMKPVAPAGAAAVPAGAAAVPAGAAVAGTARIERLRAGAPLRPLNRPPSAAFEANAPDDERERVYQRTSCA
jgi:hypothetical protein